MKVIEAIRILSNQKPFQGKGLVGILLSLLLLASCSSNDETITPDTSKDVTVTFTMSLGEPQTVTRAANQDWTDYDSIPGEGIENRVDLSNIHVYFYNTNGSYLSRVENIVVRSIDSTSYMVEGTLRVDTLSLGTGYSFSGKMMVVANADAPSLEGMSLNDAASIAPTFDYTPGRSLSSIPMWGVTTLSNVSFAPGERTQLNDVWLLRSMAKVNVNLTEDMTRRGYKLTKVTLNRYNTRGYILPSGYNQVENTRILNFDTGAALSFNPLESVRTDSVNFTDKTLYLPEYDNSTTPATITVEIQATDGSTRTATFDFASYRNGVYLAPMNVVRNHAYVFNVYGNPIKIDLKVEPWTVFTHEQIIM